MSIDRWTQADEIKLNALIKRKADIMEKHKEPVLELSAHIHEWCADSSLQLPTMLIENAKKVRDILEPFDDRGFKT